MKARIKRFLAVLLCACMVLTAMPYTVFADEGTPSDPAPAGNTVGLSEEKETPGEDSSTGEEESSTPAEESFAQEESSKVDEESSDNGEESSMAEESSTLEEESSTPEDESSVMEEESSAPEEESSTPEEESSEEEKEDDGKLRVLIGTEGGVVDILDANGQFVHTFLTYSNGTLMEAGTCLTNMVNAPVDDNGQVVLDAGIYTFRTGMGEKGYYVSSITVKDKDGKERTVDGSSATFDNVMTFQVTPEDREVTFVFAASASGVRRAPSKSSITISHTGDLSGPYANGGTTPIEDFTSALFTASDPFGMAYCGSVGYAAPPLLKSYPMWHKYSSSEFVEVTNTNIKKVLYYGYNGPAEWSGFRTLPFSGTGAVPSGTYNQIREPRNRFGAAYFATHELLSNYNTSNGSKAYGNWGSHTNAVFYSEFKAYVESAPNVPSNFHAYYLPGGAYYQDIFIFELTSKTLQLQKESANPSITSPNNCYSRVGAEYGVYTDKACTNKVATLTVGTDHKTNIVTLEAKHYYVKETKAPNGYYLDTKVYDAPLESSTQNPYVLKVADQPANDPMAIMISKQDSVNPGADYDLSGAKFEIKYYDGYYGSQSQLPSTARRTWVIQTRKNSVNGKYTALLGNSYLVADESDELYTQQGRAVLPVGTYVIREKSAPFGYLNDANFVDNTGKENGSVMMFIVKKPDQNATSTICVRTDNTAINPIITAKETPMRGDFELTKTDGETGEPLAGISFRITMLDADGNKMSGLGHSATFTVDENGHYSSAEDENLWLYRDASEESSVDNTKDGHLAAGKYVIEEIYDPQLYGGRYEVAASQTITIDSPDTPTQVSVQNYLKPEMTTVLENAQAHIKMALAAPDQKLTDYVSYKHMHSYIGQTITVRGTLVKADGTVVATADTTYAITEDNWKEGTIENGLTFDGTGMDGETLTAYEEILTADGSSIIEEKDLTNADQQITIPNIQTTAHDGDTGTNEGLAREEATIVDTVAYSKLQVGKEYTVSGVLMRQDTGEPLLDAEGNEITASTTFTAEQTDGTVDIVFTFDASLLQGKTVVAFEDVYCENIPVGFHKDITDKEQSVHYPDVHTTASDKESGTKVVCADEKAVIKDEVQVTNIISGNTYTIIGHLVYQENGEKVLVDGKPVTGTTTFTATEPDMLVEVDFTFDARKIGGKDVVVFERLFDANESLIAKHEDKDDEGQTVIIPGVRTTATDKATGNHTSFAYGTRTIVDRVQYTNLPADGSKSYTVKGVLMDKDTGEPLLVNGKQVTAQKTFVPAEPDGYVELEFTFDASALNGKRTVVFEDVYDDVHEVAVHKDLTDKDQEVDFPEIHTTATFANGKKKVYETEGKVTVTDVLTYKNLEPGRSYTVHADLMDKNTHEVAASAEITFTPSSPDGTVSVDIPLDVTGKGGHSYVVFEAVSETDSKEPVGEHKDYNDENQTVEVEKMGHVKTGDWQNTGRYTAVMLAAAALAGMMARFHRRKTGQKA